MDNLPFGLIAIMLVASLFTVPMLGWGAPIATLVAIGISFYVIKSVH